ncbi:hypothetical protein NT6N_15000 [Oceaniferula spumae]|uniref:Transposase n=1 Tax=Oceaniferula spumae TaxID=2979115 RepID=A0AAT9FKD2_9BACT
MGKKPWPLFFVDVIQAMTGIFLQHAKSILSLTHCARKEHQTVFIGKHDISIMFWNLL